MSGADWHVEFVRLAAERSVPPMASPATLTLIAEWGEWFRDHGYKTQAAQNEAWATIMKVREAAGDIGLGLPLAVAFQPTESTEPPDLAKYLSRARRDFIAVGRSLPSQLDHETGNLVAAILVLAARVEAVEDTLESGFPTAGEGH